MLLKYKLSGNLYTYDQDDEAVMKTMIQNWINFATCGDPSSLWTPIGPEENQKFMFWNISSANPEMTYSEDIKERMEIWDQVLMSDGVSNKKFKLYMSLVLFHLVWKMYQS